MQVSALLKVWAFWQAVEVLMKLRQFYEGDGFGPVNKGSMESRFATYLISHPLHDCIADSCFP